MYTQETDFSWCVQNFGRGHCEMFHDYNSTWYKRYVWSAFRNSINYFKHETIGVVHWPKDTVLSSDEANYKELIDGSSVYAWEYSRANDNMIKVPYIKLYIRLRFGYKLSTIFHVNHMKSLSFPLEFVSSIGIRRHK